MPATAAPFWQEAIMPSKLSHDDTVALAHKRAAAGARLSATAQAQDAYRETFAKAFQRVYAELMADELERAGA
jgi:hypothetical protein